MQKSAIKSLCFILTSLMMFSCSKQNFAKVQRVDFPSDTEVVKKEADEPQTPGFSDETPEAVENKGLIAPERVSTSEQEGVATISYSFESPVTEAQIISVELIAGSAKEGEDYQTPVVDQIFVRAGQKSFEVAVPIVNDDLWDVTTEDFTVQLSSADYQSSTVVEIEDDEFPQLSLRDTFFDNPTGIQPNAIIFGASPDQPIEVTLRSDADVSEANANRCGTDTSSELIALPGTHYEAVQATTVKIDAYQIETTEFNTTWLTLPSNPNRYTICFHVMEVSHN